MTLSIDPRADHLRVVGRQFFSIADAQQHFRDLAQALRDMRRREVPVRVLVDLRDCTPQSPEVAEIIRTRTNLLYQPTDRVAILAASSILKLQLKRIHVGQGFGVFLTETAAWAFLDCENVGEAA